MNFNQNISSYIKYLVRKLSDYSCPSEYLPGLDKVPIHQLVSPLRHDIFIRYKFFDFYEKNIDLFYENYDRFFQLVLESDYFIWYKNIAYPLHRNVFRDRKDLKSSFEDRVLRSIALYNSVRKNGFDCSQPIVLYSGQNICETVSGVKSSIKYYAGNGCHRISLLWLGGYKYIGPGQYIVKEYKSFTPYDNTSLLLPYLPEIESEYLLFTSSRFAFSSLIYTDR